MCDALLVLELQVPRKILSFQWSPHLVNQAIHTNAPTPSFRLATSRCPFYFAKARARVVDILYALVAGQM